MKISIITVTYNSGQTIKSTIDSVLQQRYSDIEYIIVDGQSTDDTINIVSSFGKKVSTFISEPDEGMYDALNKGISLATGDVIGILNSDDIYADDMVIPRVVEQFENEKTHSVYGDLKYVAHDNMKQTLRYWRSGKYNRNKFLYGWMPPHPTFFVKREIYQSFGGFNTNLKSAADYELMLRFLFKYGVSSSYIPEVMVLMRTGGMSNATIKNRIRGNREDQVAWKINELNSYFFTTWLKPIRKIPQYILRA